MLQPEGVADRDDEVADLHLCRVAKSDLRQAVGLDLEDRDVRGHITAENSSFESRPSCSVTVIVGGVLDDMRVGQDVAALGIKDDAGACALKRMAARAEIRRSIEEAAKERIFRESGSGLAARSRLRCRASRYSRRRGIRA